MLNVSYTCDDGSVTIDLTCDERRDAEGRLTWVVSFMDANLSPAFIDGGTIRSGCNAPLDPTDALRSLASFIGAWAEARSPRSDCYDLFSEELRATSIDFSYLAEELYCTFEPFD